MFSSRSNCRWHSVLASSSSASIQRIITAAPAESDEIHFPYAGSDTHTFGGNGNGNGNGCNSGKAAAEGRVRPFLRLNYRQLNKFIRIQFKTHSEGVETLVI